MTMYQVIGRPVPRHEGADKVTGRALYTADVSLPGTLWGRALHSPYAHARILRIDTSAAEKLPGVHAVITGTDVAGAFHGATVRDLPVLAVDRVRFVGERVAAVAADDEDIAQQALDLIEVEYEELPAVFDIEEAMADGAPILHPDFNSYEGVVHGEGGPPGLFRGLTALSRPDNAYSRNRLERGDIDRGFAEADVIVEGTYRTQRVHQGYLEPQTCLVRVREDGKVEAWAGSKVPYAARAGLARAAGIAPDDVIIHHAYIGGDFGGKGGSLLLPITYFLAKRTGRPVRMMNDYVEEFMAGNPRHATVVRMKTGVKRDGTITAHAVQFLVNSGAYAGFKPFGRIFGPTQSAGAYRIPNCRIDAAHVYTNTVPGGYMRAPGEVQAFFALESHMDVVARTLGMDPVAFRLKNLIDDGEEMPAGEPFEAVRAKETLRAAVEAAGYDAPKAPNVGRGVAIGERPPGGGEGNAAVTLRPDGRVVLGTPIFEQGTGTYTIMRQVVAEELAVPIDRVEVEVWSTGAVASDSGVAGSWATRVNTSVVYDATQEAKKELLRVAAERLGWPADRLSLRGEEIWNGELEESVRWPDLLARIGDSVTGRAHFVGFARAPVTSFTAQVAEVSVDPETGEVKLLSLVTAHDVGRILHPVAHQGQINGGVMQGIGYALMEELRVEDGAVTNLSFGDYKMPTAMDIPRLTTVLLESDAGVGPYNIKGIGETPISPVAPAIANAVADAVGVRITDLPITAEKVYRALRAQQA